MIRFAVILAGALVSALLACGEQVSVAQPVADAGFDVHSTVGARIVLDGTASHSLDGSLLSYAWRRISRPTGSASQLIGSDTSQPTFDVDAPGQYLFELVVTSGAKSSIPDIVGVVATATAPVAVVACEPANCRVLHGRTASLRGRDSYDPDGEVLSFTWQQLTSSTLCDARCPALAPCEPTDEIASILDASAANTTFTAPEGRDLHVVFELLVQDQTTSAQNCLSYLTTNTPPLIAAVSVTPTTVNEGEQFALTATTGDSEQDPLTYVWEQVSGEVSVGALPAMEDASVNAPLVGADTFVEFRLTISDGIDVTASDDVSAYAPGGLVRVNIRNVP